MDLPKRLGVISKKPSVAVKVVPEPNVFKGKNSLGSLPAELHLGIVHHLPRTSLPTICQLNKHWRSVGTDDLLRRLFPIPPRQTNQYEIEQGKDLLEGAIQHFIDTNNADALCQLVDFRPKHPYFGPPNTSLLLDEPASLRARVTKNEEDRFCLRSHWSFCYRAVKAAFKYNDLSCMKLLIDHGLADYSLLLELAVDDGYRDGFRDGRRPSAWFARPTPGPDSRGGHNSVLNWLLTYPPCHVAQAMLVMWGRADLHPRLRLLCDQSSHERRRSCDSMLILVVGFGHPAGLQVINELRMMVEILTDDASDGIILEARQTLSHALRIARGMASMWPRSPPLVVEYLQGICTWEGHQSSSSGGRSNNTKIPPPQPAPPLILPPQGPVLHRLIDLKTYDEMLEPENWLELQRAQQDHPPLQWLVSTEFLADEEAARRMHCFKRALRGLHSSPGSTHNLLHAAGIFRRWRCVEVVLGELHEMWPRDLMIFRSPDVVLCRAILDAVHGEPGCADARIIRKLLRTGAGTSEDFKGFGDARRRFSPFCGGGFGWEPFRLAFFERQQDREQRETPACMEMRDAILDYLSISDQRALNFLVGEPSKALYRASTLRRQKRLLTSG